MKERTLAREMAMQILFQWEAQGLISRKNEQPNPALLNVNIIAFMKPFLANFYPGTGHKVDHAFALNLIEGTLKHLEQIDHLLSDTSEKWKIERMNAIDRSVLRLACFELRFDKKLSARIIINEAIEIAKRFGGEHSAQFVNGILDALKV